VINKHKVKLMVILNKCDKIIEGPEERKAVRDDPLSIIDHPDIEDKVEEVSETLGVESYNVFPMISRPRSTQLSPAQSLVILRPFAFVMTNLKRCNREKLLDQEAVEYSDGEDIESEDEDDDGVDDTEDDAA